MVQSDSTLRLPSALELPCSDDTPVDNELQETVPGLLRATLQMLWGNRQDWFFGVDMGIYADTEQPRKAFVPDGFLSLGVPRFRPEYGDQGRPSYVLWEEYVMPILVLEVVSETYGGEYDKKLNDCQELEVLYYMVYDSHRLHAKHHRPLEVYRLTDGEYRLLPGEPVWIPEIGLGIGRATNQVGDWTREWLYWFNEEGERYPLPEEYQRYRADLAEKQVEAERQAKEQERQARQQAEELAARERLRAEQEQRARLEADQRVQVMAEKLKALGIDPDTL